MADIARSPLLTLNNDVEIPALGFGVYMIAPEDTAGAVRVAIEQGYRLIDAAAAYGNEKEVGDGIRDSGIDRSDVFVTTKLWIADYGYDAALRAFDDSLRRLGLEYVDLYMLHWPVPTDFEQAVAAYTAAERLLAEGRVRALGVCNYNPEHLDALIARTEITPAVNQVELHPWFNQRVVRDANASRGILTQSWSPLGGVYVNHPVDPDNVRTPLEEPTIAALADKYGKSPAQVILRWHLQHGLGVNVKSVRAQRIEENFDVFDFALGPEDIATIDGMDTGVRGGPDPAIFDMDFLTSLG